MKVFILSKLIKNKGKSLKLKNKRKQEKAKNFKKIS